MRAALPVVVILSMFWCSCDRSSGGSIGEGRTPIGDPDQKVLGPAEPVTTNGGVANNNNNPGGNEPGGGGSSPVPEPGTMLLVGSSLAGLGILGRRKRRRVEPASGERMAAQ